MLVIYTETPSYAKVTILQFDVNGDNNINFFLPKPVFVRTALPVQETTVMRGNYSADDNNLDDNYFDGNNFGNDHFNGSYYDDNCLDDDYFAENYFDDKYLGDQILLR